MRLSRTFSQLLARKTARPACRKRRARLAVERLETREVPATFTVTNLNDAGGGSLRQAILDANHQQGVDEIQFDLNFAFDCTIHLQSSLPAITERVSIEGKNDYPDSFTRPITLDGSQVFDDPVGLDIRADGTTVNGLTISNFHNGDFIRPAAGIRIRASHCHVYGCYIGLNNTGEICAPNTVGIEIVGDAHNNVIGPRPGHDFSEVYNQFNVISGNEEYGVFIHDGPHDNTLAGDWIGPDSELFDPPGGGTTNNGLAGVFVKNANDNRIGDPNDKEGNAINFDSNDGVAIDHSSGTTVRNSEIAHCNLGSGVHVFGGSTHALVGGAGEHDGNSIHGNPVGVTIENDGTENNRVEGNKIGSTDNHTWWNSFGVVINNGASHNTIGGTRKGAGNIISGNLKSGVDILGRRTDENTVAGNLIGLTYFTPDAKSATPDANGEDGVLIQFGASHNTVGGDSAAARNIISSNGLDGVAIEGTDDPS